MIKAFNGKTPSITESAFISEAAYIVGDVEIGGNFSVFPGAVIRGDFAGVRIGQNVVIEDNCVLHAGPHDLIIGNNVVIGHGAVINCHRVGDNVLVGMNSTLLHKAEIGSNCVIAAAALVSEGMKVPDDSFVTGVPGKIKGKPTTKQLWWVNKGSEAYSRLAKQYKTEQLWKATPYISKHPYILSGAVIPIKWRALAKTIWVALTNLSRARVKAAFFDITRHCL